MSRSLSEAQLRAKFNRAHRDHGTNELARRAGVSGTYITLLVQGAPLGPRIARYLGYERVTVTRYHKLHPKETP